MSDKKTLHEEFDYEHGIISEGIEELFTHIDAGFIGLIAGKELYSISLQSSSDGSYRFIARAKSIDGSGATVGVIAYGNGETMADTLAALEACLRFNNLGWREDKYYKPSDGSLGKKKSMKRVKLDPPKLRTTR